MKMLRLIKFRRIFWALLLVVPFSSCLKRDLPEFAAFDTNEITLVNAEYRFNGPQNMYGQPIMAFQKLDVAQQIDYQSNAINIQISVPAPNNQFSAEERANVVQTKLWFYMNISTAATIAPLEGTARLGDPTDATKPLKYEVTAANGAKRVWTVNVTSFTK